MILESLNFYVHINPELLIEKQVKLNLEEEVNINNLVIYDVDITTELTFQMNDLEEV